jgi:SAM-dependent methyltransferase
MSDALHDYRETWKHKPVLRAIYDDFHDRIVAACIPGATIEIGGGIGNLKERLPNVVATDVQFAPWLDCVANAQYLPFATGTAANIVMVDVLHHVEFPHRFFSEAGRVLRGGGRIVMVEPAITWGSTLFYRLLHHEPVRTSADPLAEGTPDPNRDPYDANQAIPTLIATRHRDRFHRLFPNFRIVKVNWFAFAVYPMSGGFKSWSLIPERAVRVALAAERILEPILGSVAGFRMILVIERRARFDSTHGKGEPVCCDGE